MTYPKYYKTSAHQIKIIDAETEIWVTGLRIEVDIFHNEDFIKSLDAVESTETEFKKAFNKTSKYLKSLI